MTKSDSSPKLTYILAIVGLVLLSSLATYYLADLLRADATSSVDGDTKRALGIVEKRPRYSQFAGHNTCESAIRTYATDKIITLRLEQRAAQYNETNRSNVLIYYADMQLPNTPFLSEQASTKAMRIKCITSADDNKLLSLGIEAASR